MKKLMMGAVALCIAAFATSCSKEEKLEANPMDKKGAACKVWTDDYVSPTDPSAFFDKVVDIYGKSHEPAKLTDSRGNFFKLGFIVKENSQNPGQVWALVDETNNKWRRLNECRSRGIAGFWDGLSKNESVKARILQQGTNKNAVYVFFGLGKVSNFKKFFVDNGEVLKAHNQPTRTLPSGFGAGSLFYHDHHRADFPPNWLGIKGKKLYNFGSSIQNSNPTIIPVRNNGWNGTDYNGKIKRIVGYWNPNTARIIIERDGKVTSTFQKERRQGVNYYKD